MYAAMRMKNLGYESSSHVCSFQAIYTHIPLVLLKSPDRNRSVYRSDHPRPVSCASCSHIGFNCCATCRNIVRGGYGRKSLASGSVHFARVHGCDTLSELQVVISRSPDAACNASCEEAVGRRDGFTNKARET
jgi:hypothetical protein